MIEQTRLKFSGDVIKSEDVDDTICEDIVDDPDHPDDESEVKRMF